MPLCGKSELMSNARMLDRHLVCKKCQCDFADGWQLALPSFGLNAGGKGAEDGTATGLFRG